MDDGRWQDLQDRETQVSSVFEVESVFGTTLRLWGRTGRTRIYGRHSIRACMRMLCSFGTSRDMVRPICISSGLI